jgi:hypothetical protein
MDTVIRIWRRYATNLTDENIEMKVAMEPYYMSGRWPNMRRGSVWVARKIAVQLGAHDPSNSSPTTARRFKPLSSRCGDASCRRRDCRLGLQLLAVYERRLKAVRDDSNVQAV